MSDLTDSTQSRSALRYKPFVFAILGVIFLLVVGGLRWNARAAETTTVPRASSIEPVPSTTLAFSNPPKDEEFLRTGLFEEPLIATAPTDPRDSADLARALNEYQEAGARSHVRDEIGALDAFLATHPSSPWRASLLTNEGAVFRRTGHFSRAMTVWQAAWDLTKDSSDPRARIVADTALASLSQFEAYLGRKELLVPLLQEVRGRPVRGAAAQKLIQSRRGLSDMLNDPDHSFRCGPLALAAIVNHDSAHPPLETMRVLEAAKSTPNGLSLEAVQAISAQAGMNYQMAFRSPGAPLVVPSVAHWKLGHYAALVGRQGTDRYLVQDATFGEDLLVRETTIDDEASGYFLLPPGPLPTGWRPVDITEGGRIWGRGDTGLNNDVGATGPQEKQAFACPKGGGCTAWNVEAMVVGLSLNDDPVGYTPPIGPQMRFKLWYSQRDQMQPATFTYTNFGPRWTSNWISYIVNDQNRPMLYRRGGGNEFYSMQIDVPGSSARFRPIVETTLMARLANGALELLPVATAQAATTTLFLPPEVSIPAPPIPAHSEPGPFSQGILTSDSTGYVRTLPDGSVERFKQVVDHYRYYFLTSVSDPQGNTVSLSYDSQARLRSLTDAIGQVTTISYELASDPLKVTKVTDPFGRFATFTYDAMARLASITDVLGITSSYAYQSPADVDFVTSLTTPYGTTTFQTGESADPFAYTADPVGPTDGVARCDQTKRWVQIRDALGGTQRVEFCDGAPGVPDIDPTATGFPQNPLYSGNIMATRAPPFNDQVGPIGINLYLSDRNTYIWNSVQYAAAQKTDGTLDYTKASLVHWMHTPPPTYNNASRVIESTKEPLENRVWYAYQGCPWPHVLGASTINKPIIVARIMPDNQTVALNLFTYNNLGNLLTVSDPANRELTLTYDPANNFDIVSVTNTSAGHNDLLASYHYTNHTLDTVTTANGSATTYLLNAAGQNTLTTYPSPQGPIKYVYTPDGYLQDVQVLPSPNGGAFTTVQSYTYDTFGRVKTATNGAGYSITYTYDAADRVTAEVYDDGTQNSFGYNVLDLATVTDRVGRTTSIFYDANRRPYEITASDATTATRAAFVQYDGTDSTRPLSVTDSMGGKTWYDRDIEGRPFGRHNDAEGIYDPYQWNVIGQLVSDSRATYAYNLDGTLHSIVYNDANTPSVTMTYDPAYARVQTVASATAAITYGYYSVQDGLGANRLHTVQTAFPDSAGTTDTVAYAYDALGRAVTQTVSSTASDFFGPSTETTSFDWLGRVQTIVNLLGEFDYNYIDLTSRPASIAGVSEGAPSLSLTYGDAHDARLVDALSWEYGSTDQWNFSYDATGQIASTQHNTDPAASYVYDTWGELTTVETAGQPWATYAYDANGNMETAPGMSSASNRVAGVGYDARGNVTYAFGWSYTWDGADRLVSAEDPAGLGTSTFTYDGLGRLIEVDDHSAAGGGIHQNHRYLWCGGAPCAAHDETLAGAPVSKHYFAQGTLDVSTGGEAFYRRDRLGTPAGATDPYGNSNASAFALNGDDIGFAGYWCHKWTGLCFAGARIYNPQLRRWMSRDPIGQAGGLNPYQYASNDPLNQRDPSGLCPWCEAVGFEVGAVTGGVYYALTAPTDLSWSQFASGAIGTATYYGALGALAAAGGVALGDAVANAPAVARALAVAAGAGGGASTSADGAENCAAEGAGAAGNAGQELVTVLHFTGAEGAPAIEASGALRAGSFVTLPGEVSGMSAAEVEEALEILPGRGAFSGTLQTPASNLVTPFNGPVTSGGAVQFQIVEPIPVTPGTFVPTE